MKGSWKDKVLATFLFALASSLLVLIFIPSKGIKTDQVNQQRAVVRQEIAYEGEVKGVATAEPEFYTRTDYQAKHSLWSRIRSLLSRITSFFSYLGQLAGF